MIQYGMRRNTATKLPYGMSSGAAWNMGSTSANMTKPRLDDRFWRLEANNMSLTIVLASERSICNVGNGMSISTCSFSSTKLAIFTKPCFHILCFRPLLRPRCLSKTQIRPLTPQHRNLISSSPALSNPLPISLPVLLHSKPISTPSAQPILAYISPSEA
jgi:hypothetical protein